MKIKTKKALVILALVIVFAFTAGAGLLKNIESNLSKLADLPLSSIDLTRMEDGTYAGSFRQFPVSAEVEVTVANHMITDIRLLKHNYGQGAGAEIIPSRVVEAQTLQVDTVSGATYSSKVILKALEDALKKSP